MLHRNVLSAALLLPALVVSTRAAVAIDPVLTTGASAIDPSGSRTIDTSATGSYPAASLTAHSSFRGAIQSGWTSFVGASTSTNNIYSFTNSTLPDLSFDISGSYGATAGASVGNVQRTTSASSGYSIFANAGGSIATPVTVTLTINLGNYASGVFTNGATVDAVGFTLSDIRSGQTATVRFYNASNSLLSTQSIVSSGTFTDNDSFANSRDGYFGYAGNESIGLGVSKIVIDISYTAGGTFAKGLDDFGFTSVITAIPEPSTAALLIGAAGLLFAGTRRSRRR